MLFSSGRSQFHEIAIRHWVLAYYRYYHFYRIEAGKRRYYLLYYDPFATLRTRYSLCEVQVIDFGDSDMLISDMQASRQRLISRIIILSSKSGDRGIIRLPSDLHCLMRL